jgi:ribonuclease Z
MEKIKITFLGTGNAVPTKQRNHTAILIEFKNEHILIDCGEGTQRQFKYAEISPAKLTRLLITHWHGDHILGIPGLFQTLAMNDYQKTLFIYGPKSTKRKLDLLQELHNDIKINFKAEEVSGIFIDNPVFSITAEEMNHNAPTLAYSIQLKDQVRINKKNMKKLKISEGPHIKDILKGKDITFNGKKVKAKDLKYTEKGKKITIILDTKINQNAVRLAKDSDILICGATFSKEEDEQAKRYKHLTNVDSAEIAKKAKAKQLILMHASQRHEHELDKIKNEAKRIFSNTKIAKDLEVIEI